MNSLKKFFFHKTDATILFLKLKKTTKPPNGIVRLRSYLGAEENNITVTFRKARGFMLYFILLKLNV